MCDGSRESCLSACLQHRTHTLTETHTALCRWMLVSTRSLPAGSWRCQSCVNETHLLMRSWGKRDSLNRNVSVICCPGSWCKCGSSVLPVSPQAAWLLLLLLLLDNDRTQFYCHLFTASSLIVSNMFSHKVSCKTRICWTNSTSILGWYLFFYCLIVSSLLTDWVFGRRCWWGCWVGTFQAVEAWAWLCPSGSALCHVWQRRTICCSGVAGVCRSSRHHISFTGSQFQQPLLHISPSSAHSKHANPAGSRFSLCLAFWSFPSFLH